MYPPKILVVPGSTRSASYNARLAALAAKELTLAGADVTRISLIDYPLPVYDADAEAGTGWPSHAVKLKQLFCAHQGVLITSPEYNASITALLKNAIDWVSRIHARGEPLHAAFRNRAFAIASVSPERFGGMRSVLALRQVLEIGCGALVIPEHVCVPQAEHAFDEMDNLIDTGEAEGLRALARRLVEVAGQLA